ncbi:COX aromatic rich motif-containing protein [Candidatus Coxiella mudrowiae]|uniref:COX aromatic rich motif-containing protein n=1 Tax=Candidatus Coxiella mudrowiae TaxID=2054173 RepID=UPI00156262C6|nr:COX aromatic rich motif-containing protein [Candidatus Coxiella mudrowiae]
MIDKKNTKLCNSLKKMVKFSSFGLSILSVLTLVGCRTMMTGILSPAGVITYEEKQLFFDSLALMLIVVIPVLIMSFTFIVRYRASHKTSDYQPNWGHSVLLEAIWWGIPMAIIFVLGIITWTMSHKLDPYRPIIIKGAGKPMVIQVVALPWKWLFIYPEQNIATVNYLEIARSKQVEFMFTNDNVPMSAFFIPQLGSQIYTMAGMRTRLHLIASRDGTYEGLDSQYNGDGFSDMCFDVKVVEPNELQRWFAEVKRSGEKLTPPMYEKLIQPSIKEPVHYYSSVVSNLFSQIMIKYMQTTGMSTQCEYKESHY